MLEVLVDNGFAYHPGFSVYFAPIKAMTCDCRSIADVTLDQRRYARLELELLKSACKMGLAYPPHPPRFQGKCAAVLPKGFVILPDGELHKCWDTVSDTQKAVGSIFEPEKLSTDERHLKWLHWSPFEVEQCKICNILPICSGSCPHKFVHPSRVPGATTLPCSPWKENINDMLLLYAQYALANEKLIAREH